MIKSLLLIIAILGLASTQGCSGFNTADLIQSGKHAFVISSFGGNPIHNYETPIYFPIDRSNFQVAVSTSTIAGFNSAGGFVYNVQGSLKNNQDKLGVTLTIANGVQWSSIQISYFATSRTDFTVGHALADEFQFDYQSDGTALVTVDIPSRNIVSNQQYDVAVFISGVDSDARAYNLQLYEDNYVNTQLSTLTIHFQPGAQFYQIIFAYIIYPKVHPIFTIVKDSTPQGDGSYQLSGPTRFNKTGLEYHEFRIQNRFIFCEGEQCPSRCIITENCEQDGGNLFQGKCFFCPDGVTFQAGVCTSRCGPNQVWFLNRVCVCKQGYDRAGSSCVPKCSGNQVWQNDQCVCPAGNSWYDSSCRACPPNSQPSQDKTTCVCSNQNEIYSADANSCNVCPENSLPNNGQTDCLCIFDHIKNAQGQCVPDCDENQFYSSDQKTCNCKSGFKREGSICVQVCKTNQIWENDQCVCIPGSSWFEGSCRLCPSDSIPNVEQTTCVCQEANEFYSAVQNLCVLCSSPSYFDGIACITCEENAGYNVDTLSCQCLDGYELQGSKCVSKCIPTAVWVDGACQCKPNYHFYQIDCRPCPADSTVNNDQTSCNCDDADKIYSITENICQACPAYSSPNQDKSACQCDAGYQFEGAICVADIPECGLNEEYSADEQKCVCLFGYIMLGDICVNRCGINQQWNGQECVCVADHAFYEGNCRLCPATSVPNADKTSCLCNSPSQIFVPERRLCEECPAFSDPNADKTECICDQNYQKDDNDRCVPNCPANSELRNGQCECVQNYYNDNGVCVAAPQCPQNSEWDRRRLQCKCTIPGQNLIGRRCRACKENQVFDGERCVCDEGFNKIFGVCRTCDPNSNYDGSDCICNHGYYGDRDNCDKCHDTCGTCSGTGADECLTCIDISYELNNGFCEKDICPPGTYLEGSNCEKCTDYCNDCDSLFSCDLCAEGFQLETQSVDGQQVSFCIEKCGDGRRFEDACDDNNYDDGDGCSSSCGVEEGWTCFGGSSAVPSTCLQLIPDNAIIQPTGAVSANGKVYQQVRMSYLPECAREFQCAQCHQLLEVRVKDSIVKAVGVKVSYVPNSNYQFLLEFDFGSAFVSSAFTFVVQLNRSFGDCFSEDDMNQQITWYVDPAKLKLSEQTGELSLEQIGVLDNIDTI